jgi:hypothetical protein
MGVNEEGIVGLHFTAFPQYGDERHLELIRMPFLKEYVIHGTVFADFLDMAQHLLDNGYKDAAAVIAGSSLESHLRHLCSKHGVDADTPDGKHKKADRINAELTKPVRTISRSRSTSRRGWGHATMRHTATTISTPISWSTI